MASNIFVKVVGFSDTERHSLNTLFRLSCRNDTTYVLWTPECSSAPNVALIDMQSYESGLELASPSLNSNLKFICVGSNPARSAWRAFDRPVDWRALVRALDELFDSQADVDIDLGMQEIADRKSPLGLKVSLLIGLNLEQRFYLRARLSLAGITQMDEAKSIEEANTKLSNGHYDLIILSLDLGGSDSWTLVESLKNQRTPSPSVIVATAAPTWRAMERADQSGCTGLLEIPFSPQQVMNLLNKV